jgi:hypothetical protein
MQMDGRNIDDALMGRALLRLAWLCPAALAVAHATALTDAMARAVVSAGKPVPSPGGRRGTTTASSHSIYSAHVRSGCDVYKRRDNQPVGELLHI